MAVRVEPTTRTCERCGTQFLAGGRGRRKLTARFCSRQCHGQSRKLDRSHVCETCRTAFTATNKGERGRSTRYCSPVCAGVGRTLPSSIPQLAATDAAYLAGLMDGEGSIFFTGPTGRVRYLRVVVTNTSLLMLEWLTERVGGSVTAKQATYMTRVPCWTWAAHGESGADVLRQILPYMTTKRDKAVKALDRHQH